MDKLEKWFGEHKDSFDRLTARPSLWDDIQSSMDRKSRRRSLLRKTAGWAAAVLLLTFGLWGVSRYGVSDQLPPTVESVLPDIQLPSPNGEVIRLSDLNSEIVLVNFWASWHEACQEKNCYVFLPMYEKYREQGFEIYGISIDADKKDWISRISEDDLPWIQVSDLKSWQSPIARSLSVTRLPTSYLIDKDRNIIAKDLNAEELDEALSKLLAYNQ